MELPETCSVEELAEALGRSYRWVLDAAATGRIPSLKVGGRVRFTQEQVDEIFAMFTRTPKPSHEAARAWGRPVGRKRRRTP